MKVDIALFVGRFQPFHNGHLHVIKQALNAADKLVIAIGSANGPRSHHNPFTYKEREQMILLSLTEEERARVTTFPVSDYLYNEDEWIENVQKRVTLIANATVGPNAKISLIGHSKDNTSYYLKMFPEWKESIEVGNYKSLSATPMRDAYFRNGSTWLETNGKNIIPEGALGFLHMFSSTEIFAELCKEFDFIRNYRKEWGTGPFVTVDACVIQSGNVLMIRRAGRPGKGLWALPGGFLDMSKNETLVEAMLRELDEETKIDVPPAVLRGSIVHNEAFDGVFRDPRARIITHAYLINLRKNEKLPFVKAESDAAEARWIPIGGLHEEHCFGDHFHMIQRLRGVLPKEPK